MGLMKGTASVCRFRVEPFLAHFVDAAFEPIPDGSEIRRSIGFVPMVGREPYKIGGHAWAGRMRLDEIKPDRQTVLDRIEELFKREYEAGARAIGKLRRRELKELAIEESCIGVPPKRKYVEWVLQGETLYVGSTNKSDVGEVLQLMRRCGAAKIEAVVPWENLPRMESSVLDFNGWGPRFLRHLFEANSGREFDLEFGRMTMKAADHKINLTGDIAASTVHHLEQGAEIVSAKMAAGGGYTLDAERWWIKSATLLVDLSDHWTDHLMLRIEAIEGIYDALETAFKHHLDAVTEAVEGDGRAWIQTQIEDAARQPAADADSADARSAPQKFIEDLDTPAGREAVKEFMGPSAEVSDAGHKITVRADEMPS